MVKLITWCSGLSVHIREIDEQHKKIIDCINELHSALAEGEEPGVVERVVDELMRYACVHFRFEEDMLRRRGYPELDAHLVEHRDFERRIEEYRMQIAAGRGPLLPESIMNFLANWLEGHIMGSDQEYALFLAGQPAS